jgi:putative membrane protein
LESGTTAGTSEDCYAGVLTLGETVLKKRREQTLASVVYPAALAGLALFTWLIAYQGVREVGTLLAGAGAGLVVVAVFHIAPLLANAAGWRVLLSGRNRLPLGRLVWARWIAESINSLLPVMQIGGNVVRAQLIARHGATAAAAGASVVVDITLNIVAQLIFTLVGLGLLTVYLGGWRVAVFVLLGMAIMASLLAGFYVTQRRGLFGTIAPLLTRIARHFDRTALALDGAEFDAAVARLYGQRRVLAATGAWHLLSWFLGAGEVYLALAFLGHPVAVLTAVLIESLGQALRTSAFVVPGALGVQEGGYLFLGTIFGISPETALALSLAKRVRELLLGIPGLAAWQIEAAAGWFRAGDAERSGVRRV